MCIRDRGYMIHPESALSEVKTEEVGSFIIPGGDIEEIDRQEVWDMLRLVKKQGGILAGICAGVDVLEHAGILEGIISTHAADLDVAVSEQVITARANGYVDFAIEVAKKLDLFENEADLQETITFFREMCIRDRFSVFLRLCAGDRTAGSGNDL